MSEQHQPTTEAPAQTQPLSPGAVAAEPYEQPLGEDGAWLPEAEPLPPRPRRRLLTPVPLSLLAVLLVACGFIAGVLVEKGQSEGGGSSGASGASAFASRLRSLAGGATGSGGSTGSSGLGGTAASASGFARPTEGTVAYLSGSTLYVTNSESNTVKVKTSAATSVTKTVTSAVKDIHPGETVTITGATGSNGTVTAESIRVGSAGSGLAALFGGGAGGSGAATGGSGSSSSTSSSGQALFGSG